MPRERAVPQLERMVDALCHSTHYVKGTSVEESLGVYVGWVSRKGSFSEGMPLRNEHRDVILAFSGEEFPEPDIAQRLKERGHDLNGPASSYLVHVYEEDPSFPASLNGRFHGLVADLKRNAATLFVDRYGMHRIYYYESKEAFYFAAEAKAIVAVCPQLKRMNPRSVGEFISCGSVLENRTLFDGIHVLPPSSAWVFRNGSLDRKGSYFHPREWEDQEPIDPESWYTELRAAFARNLPRYFKGNQRVAISLTGGLDSRMIMAWQKSAPGSLPCYTFGGPFRDCQDVIVGRKVARACGQTHDVIPAGSEFLAGFPHYAERAVYLTDGCVDVSRAPDVYLNEKVREIAPIRMTGLFGGEVLRRVRAFKPQQPFPGLFDTEFLSHIHRASETYAALLPGHPVSFAVFKQAPWHHYGGIALEQASVDIRSPYLDNEFVRTVFRGPQSALATNEASQRLVADGNKSLSRIPTDRGVGGHRGRISEAASRALLEFLFKAEYAYDMGMPQWVARLDHALSRLRLEQVFLGRHKIFHFRSWYRDALSGYIQEILLDHRTLSRPYFQKEGLQAMVRGHVHGDRNYTNEIHKTLALEHVHRLFLD